MTLEMLLAEKSKWTLGKKKKQKNKQKKPRQIITL